MKSNIDLDAGRELITRIEALKVHAYKIGLTAVGDDLRKAQGVAEDNLRAVGQYRDRQKREAPEGTSQAYRGL